LVDEKSRGKILYVEDDLSIAALFRTIVNTHGYYVETVETGAEGLTRHKDTPFDIIFVDYQLPDMTGLDLCRKLLLEDPEMSLAMITGKGDQRLVIEALNLGVAQYIQKDDTQVYLELVPSIIESLMARGTVRLQKRLAEQERKASDERYRMAAEIAKLGHWTWDEIHQRMTSCSRGLAEIYGVSVDDYLERSSSLEGDYRWYHPDDVAEYRRATQSAKEKKTGFNVVCRIINANDDVRWIRERADVVLAEDGTLLECFGVTQDITEIKLAGLEVEARTRELSESEERLRAIIDNLPFELTLKDLDGKFTLINPVAKALTNNVFVGGTAHDFWPEEMASTFREQDRKVVEAGEPITFEDHIPGNDGPRTILTTKFPLLDEMGTPYSVGAIGIDVTEQRIVAKSLEESQRLAKVGSWRWSRKRNELVSFSHEYANVIGVPHNKVRDHVNTHGYDLIHEDDRERFVKTFEAAVSEGRDYTIEYRLQQPTGDVRNIYEIGEAIRLPNGECLELRGTVQDVTEQKKAEQEIILAREAAESANQAKSEFLSSMSHELRTPLNAILGFAQMLDYNPKEPLSGTQKSSVEQILKGGNHLLQLINEILDLARIEAGMASLSLEEVELSSVINDCLVLTQEMAEEREIKTSVTGLHHSGLIVWADFTRLKQVTLNLLSNAIKYNRKAGSISIICEENDNGMIKVAITDAGNGIPAERQSELFRPFSRLDAANSEIEGTGIGLVVCQNLIELMNGSIGFESSVGEGSTFWFEIPSIVEHQVAGNLDATADDDPHAQHLDNIEGTMLYVEDNPSNLQLMEMIVANIDGLTMYSAHTAELGIEIAKSKQPSIIILDINLPGMSGLEAVKVLRNEEVTKDIPVLALSAAATKKDVELGLKAGFQKYLTKPVKVVELTDAIKEALNT